jgi:hypothetical protein
MRIGIITFMAVFSIAATDAMADIVTFDAADNPVVSHVDQGSPTWNAGGYWDISSAGESHDGCTFDWAYGNVLSMTAFTVDLKGDFTISGFAVTIYNHSDEWLEWRQRISGLDNYTEWTTVTIPMVEANWENINGTWGEVMGNVTRLELYAFPSPSSSMDNVGFVPEPATMSMLAIGGLALIRRRRFA